MKSSARLVALVSALALFAGAPRLAGVQEPPAEPAAPPPAAAPAARPQPQPPTFGEVLDVQLVTVPFYVVDRKGEPVYDLTPGEIELWLDGERVEFDYFDRYGADEPLVVEGRREAEADRLLPPATPRHLFLLFDLAFTLPRGLAPTREAARKVVEAAPESDWLYLLTHHTQSGFQQLLGPVQADAEGKRRMIETIMGLKPNVERVRRWADLPTIDVADCERCIPSDNLVDAYIDVNKTEKVAYAAQARSLAGSLAYFASFLRQLHGPRTVLFFTQGIDSTLYTEGIRGADGGQFAGMGLRLRPIREDFEAPLRALGETGALVLFVNTAVNLPDFQEDTPIRVDPDAVIANDLLTGETALAMMAETSGGRVFHHTNVETLKDRIVDFTSAYYEVGFHTAGHRYRDSPRAKLEVTRPGVEVWVPKWAKTRREYRRLDVREKRFLITDLVLHGPEARSVREVSPSTFFRLDGSFGGSLAQGERALTFDAKWPDHLRAKALELYSVVLKPGENLLEAEIVAYKDGIYSPGGPTSTLDVAVPGEGRYVWGIVAVESGEGAFYLRRMMIEPEPVATTSSSGR